MKKIIVTVFIPDSVTDYTLLYEEILNHLHSKGFETHGIRVQSSED